MTNAHKLCVEGGGTFDKDNCTCTVTKSIDPETCAPAEWGGCEYDCAMQMGIHTSFNTATNICTAIVEVPDCIHYIWSEDGMVELGQELWVLDTFKSDTNPIGYSCKEPNPPL